MDTDIEKLKKGPLDEVDFTSGFEKQHLAENQPLNPINVAAPDPKKAWYRNLDTILIVIFLVAIFIGGSFALLTKIFAGSLLKMAIVMGIYIVVALFFIFAEVKSIHVR